MIVFTDLDGTLLDHKTYTFEPARPALEALRARRITVVMASSKTAAEIAPLRATAGLDDCPAIVENGAGILPAGPFAETGASRSDFHARLRAARSALPPELARGFSGFSDWSVERVMARTGLDRDAALRARQRLWSEPGEWDGSQADRLRFVEAMSSAGFTVLSGGRFLTISQGGTKADRMAEVADDLKNQGHRGPVVALGDAPNDIAMLEAADIGIIIPNSAHEGLPPLVGEASGRIIRAAAPGPEGWRESVTALLARLDKTDAQGAQTRET